MKVSAFYDKKTLQIKGNTVEVKFPLIMGILNVTPDSFYDGGEYVDHSEAINQAKKMVEDGAKIIDIGGYSTRPGAQEISVSEEIDRIKPIIERLKIELPHTIISIDTFRSNVAKEAVISGADIINDVSGGNLDDQMFKTVAELQTPYILMHMRGTPATMQSLSQYDDVVQDVYKELNEKCLKLKELGVEEIIIDPGFGFAKDVEQNFTLLRGLKTFQQLGHPLLVGISRKSMIYKSLNIESEEALNGTTVLNTFALLQGASILRVHDVKEAAEANTLIQKLT